MAKNPERRDLFAGALELMILHSLRLKPMHGYALVKHIKHVSDDLLQIEEGSLYPALQRLLRAGLLNRGRAFRPKDVRRGFTASPEQASNPSNERSPVSKRCLLESLACSPWARRR